MDHGGLKQNIVHHGRDETLEKRVSRTVARHDNGESELAKRRASHRPSGRLRRQSRASYPERHVAHGVEASRVSESETSGGVSRTKSSSRLSSRRKAGSGDRGPNSVSRRGPDARDRALKRLGRLGLRELWRYRELLYFLTWKNILIQYKQAVLGVAWAVLNPILTMIVFTVIFNKLLGVGSGKYGVPYPVFVYAACCPGTCSPARCRAPASSLVGNANLITKVYFPRLVIPGSAVLGKSPNFLISFVVLMVLMAVYRVAPTWNARLAAVLRAARAGHGDGRLAVAERPVCALPRRAVHHPVPGADLDVPVARHVSREQDPAGKWSVIYSLNPMTGVIGGFRWALFGEQPPSTLFWLSAAMVVVVFVGGLYYFRRMERVFADLV